MKKIISMILAAILCVFCCIATASCTQTPEQTTSASTEGADTAAETNPGETGKKYTVGICQLLTHDALDAATEGFKKALIDELGEANVTFDLQNAAGDSGTCTTIVNSFVSQKVDLIMANATPALQAAYNATNDIPILSTSITEYGVALGLQNFNGTVGGNVSGTSDLAPLDEQAQMIIDLVPGVQTVGIIYCSAELNSEYQVKTVSEYLASKGIEAKRFSFSDSNDIAAVTESAASECDAIYVPTDNAAASSADIIYNVVSAKKIPVIAGEEGICKKCGIATLSISYYDLGVATGKMAAKILKGEANISEMPIEYAPTTKKYNKAICEELGITIPEGYVAIEG